MSSFRVLYRAAPVNKAAVRSRRLLLAHQQYSYAVFRLAPAVNIWLCAFVDVYTPLCKCTL